MVPFQCVKMLSAHQLHVHQVGINVGQAYKLLISIWHGIIEVMVLRTMLFCYPTIKVLGSILGLGKYKSLMSHTIYEIMRCSRLLQQLIINSYVVAHLI